MWLTHCPTDARRVPDRPAVPRKPSAPAAAWLRRRRPIFNGRNPYKGRRARAGLMASRMPANLSDEEQERWKANKRETERNWRERNPRAICRTEPPRRKGV